MYVCICLNKPAKDTEEEEKAAEEAEKHMLVTRRMDNQVIH